MRLTCGTWKVSDWRPTGGMTRAQAKMYRAGKRYHVVDPAGGHFMGKPMTRKQAYKVARAATKATAVACKKLVKLVGRF